MEAFTFTENADVYSKASPSSLFGVSEWSVIAGGLDGAHFFAPGKDMLVTLCLKMCSKLASQTIYRLTFLILQHFAF